MIFIAQKNIISNLILDKFTKEQLYEKWQEEKAKNKDLKDKYDQSRKEWNKENQEKDKVIEELRFNNTYLNTDEDILKKILKLRAENKAPIDIHYRLSLLGVDMELEDIENFLINDLPENLQEYYDICKNAWLEKIKMNSKEYRYSVLEEMQTQLDKFKKYQEFCGDPQEAHSVGKDILVLVEKMGKIAKDMDDVVVENKEKVRADKIVEDLEKKSQEFVSLKADDDDITLGINNLDVDEGYIN